MKDFSRIIIIGPQGSGKGTQAQVLAKKFNLPHISSGEMFRQHVNRRSALGLKIRQLLEHGKLVPNEITNQMVQEKLENADCERGFILDGYPRNTQQAQFLATITKIEVVLDIWLDDEVVVQRLGGRRVCSCGATYHLEYNPPQKENVCDQCGQELKRRDDESEEVIRRRLEIYHQQTEPLIDYYRQQGILIEINGEPSIPQVTQEILTKLNNKDFSK